MPLSSGHDKEWERYYSETDTGLHWNNKRRDKFNWTLYNDGKLVAAVISKGIINIQFEGEFDNCKVRLYVRNSVSGLAEVVDSNSKQVATILDIRSRPPLTLEILEKGHFLIDRAGKHDYVFENQKGKRIALSRFNNDSSPVDASFKILEWKEGDPNPWLLAIIGLFIGIHRGGTFP
jgi:hypothetical protein